MHQFDMVQQPMIILIKNYSDNYDQLSSIARFTGFLLQ